MGYRTTGAFQPAEQIVVLTCDVCERDQTCVSRSIQTLGRSTSIHPHFCVRRNAGVHRPAGSWGRIDSDAPCRHMSHGRYLGGNAW